MIKSLTWKLLIYLFALLTICGCGRNSSSSSATTNLVAVTFEDKGPIVPYPITTTISIQSNTITKTESQAGQAFGEWSKQISSSDFAAIQKIVFDYNIINNTDVTFATGQQVCSGWSGMTITAQDSNTTHHFDISGQVCDMNQWPAGVRTLVSFRDSLVGTYFCSNPVPLSGQAFAAPGYIIYYKSDVDAVAETNRLATLYGFAPDYIYDAIGGFYAVLPPAILEPLRCEPSIEFMFFNAIVSIS